MQKLDQGEQTFEMLWDCRFCGTTKLLGLKDRHCPNCGGAQDPAWRYFPSEADMKFIETPRFSGADLICPACQQPNSADSKFCHECGADLTNAKQAERIEGIATGVEGAKGDSPDVVLKRFQAQQAAIALKTKPQARKVLGLPIGCVALLAVLIVGFLTFLFLSNSKINSTLVVSDLQWKRTLEVESFASRAAGACQSSVPSDAYDQNCYRKQSGSHQEYVRTDNVCHNESVQVQCGYEYSDNGNGSGSRKPKYCSEQKQVCRDEKIYRSVPDYGTWCDYKADRWGADRTLTSSGGAKDSPAWPLFNPIKTGNTLGAEREGKRTEVYKVFFKDKDGKAFNFNPGSFNAYSTFHLGSHYNIQFNRLGDAFWDTLKPVG